MAARTATGPAGPGDIRTIVAIASRQFGMDFASWLRDHAGEILVEHSHKTGKIRYVHVGGSLMLVLRPVDGCFSISIDAARVLASLEAGSVRNGVVILDDVAGFIKNGGNVFVKHVVKAPAWLRPSQDVYVVDQQGNVLAVGKTLVSGRDMAHFTRGIAVKTRHGNKEKE